MSDPNDGEEKSIRELILGLHAKVDAMRTSSLRVTRDRLIDRDKVQRHDRRIESLEHQVALITAATPGMTTWRPSIADIDTGVHSAVELEDLDDEGGE